MRQFFRFSVVLALQCLAGGILPLALCMVEAAFGRCLIFCGTVPTVGGAGQLGAAFVAISLTAITESADMHQSTAQAAIVDTG